MRAEDLGRVESAVDPDNGLAFLRQRARLVVGQSLGEGELACDLLVAFQVLEIRRRGNDGHQLRAAFGGLADLLDAHPVGFFVQLRPVGLELRVGGELIVVADIEAKMLLRRGHGLRRDDRCQQQHKEGRQDSALVGLPHSHPPEETERSTITR